MEVEVNPFDMVTETVAFFRVERWAPFCENMADAFKAKDQSNGVIGKGQDIVDNLAVAALDEVDGNFGGVNVRKLLMKECLPFLTENKHEGNAQVGVLMGPKGMMLKVNGCL